MIPGSGDDPQYEEQQQCIEQDGSTGPTPCQPAELDTLGAQGVRFVVPWLVVEAFVLGPSAHQW